MDKFSERVHKEQRKELGVQEGEEILGYTIIALLEKDDKPYLRFSGGGHYPEQTIKHLKDPQVKLLRDLWYNEKLPRIKNLDIRTGAHLFDFSY